VFELTPHAGGVWTEKILHHFKNSGTDGSYPQAGLIFDAAGDLYGTTCHGGTRGTGTVFELTPEAGGAWTEKILHNFINNGRDGNCPLASLVFDGAGNLYGTTLQAGAHGGGTVFELMPKTGGGWTEKTLHGFPSNAKDGGA
jgi:uncharacterized repeat protein (TIGR03803 family)